MCLACQLASASERVHSTTKKHSWSGPRPKQLNWQMKCWQATYWPCAPWLLPCSVADNSPDVQGRTAPPEECAAVWGSASAKISLSQTTTCTRTQLQTQTLLDARVTTAPSHMKVRLLGERLVSLSKNANHVRLLNKLKLVLRVLQS